MTQTLLLQLNPTPDQQRLLLETMRAFNPAANYVAAIPFAEHTASKVILQQVDDGFAVDSRQASACAFPHRWIPAGPCRLSARTCRSTLCERDLHARGGKH